MATARQTHQYRWTGRRQACLCLDGHVSGPVWDADMGADCNWGLAPVSYGEAPATASTQSNNSLSHRLPRGCGHLGEIDAI